MKEKTSAASTFTRFIKLDSTSHARPGRRNTGTASGSAMRFVFSDHPRPELLKTPARLVC